MNIDGADLNSSEVAVATTFSGGVFFFILAHNLRLRTRLRKKNRERIRPVSHLSGLLFFLSSWRKARIVSVSARSDFEFLDHFNSRSYAKFATIQRSRIFPTNRIKPASFFYLSLLIPFLSTMLLSPRISLVFPALYKKGGWCGRG